MNDWQWSHLLDTKLFAILQQHSVNKPMLIFCPTRKGSRPTVLLAKTVSDMIVGVMTVGELVMNEYNKLLEAKVSLPWTRPAR